MSLLKLEGEWSNLIIQHKETNQFSEKSRRNYKTKRSSFVFSNKSGTDNYLFK